MFDKLFWTSLPVCNGIYGRCVYSGKSIARDKPLRINQIHRILQDFPCKYTIARQLCYLQIFCINARMTILIGFHPD